MNTMNNANVNNREFLGEKKTTTGNTVVTDRYYLQDGKIVRERKVETYTKVKA